MENELIQKINKKVKDAVSLNLGDFTSLYCGDLTFFQLREFHSLVQSNIPVFENFLKGKDSDIIAYSGLSLANPEKEDFLRETERFFPLEDEPYEKKDLLKLHALINEYPNTICYSFGKEFEKEFSPDSEED